MGTLENKGFRMKRFWFVFLIQCFSISVYGYRKPMDWPFSVEKVESAVGMIEIGGRNAGTGYFVRDSKTLITNAHVLHGAFTVPENDSFVLNVDLPIRIVKDGKHYPVRRIKNLSMLHDLAVLEVDQHEGNFLKLSPAPFASRDVYVVGFFQGRLEYVVSHFVHKIEEDLSYSVYPHFAENEVLKGFSGSPALNSKGEVVGTLFMHRNWYFGIIKNRWIQEILHKPLISENLEDVIRQQLDEMFRKGVLENSLIQQRLGDLFINACPFMSWYMSSAKHLEQPFVFGNSFIECEKQALYWHTSTNVLNHPKVVFDVGLMYLAYKSENEQYARRAFRWIKRSAQEYHYPYAQLVLGILYKNGVGVEQSYEKALEWINKAAEQGISRAEFEKAVMYVNGQGVPPSEEKALQYIKEASSKGEATAQFTLGLIHYIEREHKVALRYFRSSALAGFNPAQMILGMMLAQNVGKANRSEDSKSWLADAMLEGRFGWFADMIAGQQVKLNRNNPTRDG